MVSRLSLLAFSAFVYSASACLPGLGGPLGGCCGQTSPMCLGRPPCAGGPTYGGIGPATGYGYAHVGPEVHVPVAGPEIHGNVYGADARGVYPPLNPYGGAVADATEYGYRPLPPGEPLPYASGGAYPVGERAYPLRKKLKST